MNGDALAHSEQERERLKDFQGLVTVQSPYIGLRGGYSKGLMFGSSFVASLYGKILGLEYVDRCEKVKRPPKESTCA